MATIEATRLIKFLYNNLESGVGSVQRTDVLRRQAAGSFLRAAETVLNDGDETVVTAWLSNAEVWMRDLAAAKKSAKG